MPDLPVRILDGEFAQPQVGGLAHGFQPADLRDAAVQHESRRRRRRAAPLDGHEPRGLARRSGWTTRWVTRRVVGSITTSASSPNASSEHWTGLPRSSLTTDHGATSSMKWRTARMCGHAPALDERPATR